MLPLVRWTLRQRRYVRILITMAVVALVCVGAGTFEIHRYAEKRHDNTALLTAAHATPVPLTTSLVPLVSGSTLPGTGALRFRRVTVTGRYLTSAQTYVGNLEQGGYQGFAVLTPLRTSSGAVLLVARGFVAALSGTEQRPVDVPAPPSGVVTVAGRLTPGQQASDQYGALGDGEITSVNPVDQAARLHAPVYAAWLSLTAHAPGTGGLKVLPGPDLSNPSGGAAQWQLLSYVVQWYAFAVLALIAPFLFSRAELKEARRRWLGVDDDAEQIDAAPLPAELAGVGGAGGDGAALVLRGPAGAVSRVDPDSPEYRQAARLADRYGRSLSIDDEPPPSHQELPAPRRREAVVDADSETFGVQVVADSRATPHRSVDEYQGSYNDYLWQLAMADGEELPDSAPDAPADSTPDVVVRPRIIDVESRDR